MQGKYTMTQISKVFLATGHCEAEITPAVVRKVASILHVSQGTARRYITRTRGEDMSRIGTFRGTGGQFARGPITALERLPTTGRLCTPLHAQAFLDCILRDLKDTPLTCPVTTGTGPKSISQEVRVHNEYVDDLDKKYGAHLTLLYQPARDLIARLYTDQGLPVPPLSEIPSRIFICCYPAEVNSGMVAHRDSHVAYAALTLALSTDVPGEGGTFFTGTALEGGDTQPWPLQAGEAVVIMPHCVHGVYAATRSDARVTVNFFW
jgi:hypothetical protein